MRGSRLVEDRRRRGASGADRRLAISPSICRSASTYVSMRSRSSLASGVYRWTCCWRMYDSRRLVIRTWSRFFISTSGSIAARSDGWYICFIAASC